MGAGPEPDVCSAVRAAEALFVQLFPGSPFFAPPPLPDGTSAAASSDDEADAALLAPLVAQPAKEGGTSED